MNIDNYNHKYYSLLPFEQEIYISPKTCINKKQEKYLTLSVDNFFSSILQEKNTWHIGIIHVHLSVHRHRWNSNKLHNSSHSTILGERKIYNILDLLNRVAKNGVTNQGFYGKKNRIINKQYSGTCTNNILCRSTMYIKMMVLLTAIGLGPKTE